MTESAARTIFVDASPLKDQNSLRGIGVYVRELLRAFSELDPIPEQISTDEAEAASADLRHWTALPRSLNRETRNVVTVHDLIPLRYPHTVFRPWRPRVFLSYLRRLFGLRTATLLIADSECTKSDLVRILRVPEERVRVVPLGVSRKFTVGVSSKFERPTVLAVGAGSAHKNFSTLLRAHAIVLQQRPVDVVFVGIWTNRGRKRMFRITQKLGTTSNVKNLGLVSDEELCELYRHASVFVFPSLYEGFGLPILEAMASGTPVVASTAASIPEVAGDAAILVPPKDAGAFAAAIIRVLESPELAEELRNKGLARAAEFTWARSARLTLDAYRFALGYEAESGP